mgnify:CR=1 FL=1
MSKTKKTMYVGPSLEAIAARNTVFEKLPDALEAAIKKRPYLQSCGCPTPRPPGAAP